MRSSIHWRLKWGNLWSLKLCDFDTVLLSLGSRDISCFICLKVRMSSSSLLFWHPAQRVNVPHLLECGAIVKLLLRAYGCLNHCSPTFPGLFNLTVPLLTRDKMENPCSAGLSELSTHSLVYKIPLQIPSLHTRYDPINVRIYCLCLSLPATSIKVKDLK